jgi:hypothetical protein
MKTLMLISTLAIAPTLSISAMAQSSIGEVSSWKHLENSPVLIKRDVLSANRVAQGLGNSVEEAFARAEQYCSSAISKELAQGNRVLALRGRIISQVSNYLYTAECDIQYFRQ